MTLSPNAHLYDAKTSIYDIACTKLTINKSIKIIFVKNINPVSADT